MSSDRSQEGFDDYLEDMPWIAVPFAQDSHRSGLASEFGVTGIPCLVLLRPDGTTMTKSGRGLVERDPEGKTYPWPE